MSLQDYRLTLSSVIIEPNWTSSPETLHGVVSYASPYDDVPVEQFNNYQHVVDQDFANDYILKYFSSFSKVKSNSIDTGLLSPGLKAIGTNYIIFEKPPCFKNIFYVPSSKHEVTEGLENQHIFRIPIPWQLYFVKFNKDMYTYEVRMFFMKTSLTSVDQELFLPSLPNFYTNAMLCPPTMDKMDDVDRYSKNHAGVMQCAYDWVWNSGTNHDLTEACLQVPFQLNQNDSILKHLPQLIYDNYFKYDGISSRHSSRYSANFKQIVHLFTAWEKSSLFEVCNLSWPNISGSKSNFSYHDIESDIEGYYDHLYNFISDQDEDQSLNEDDINYMIENGDYNSEDYYRYLRANNLIPSLPPVPWEKTYLYSDILPDLIKSVHSDLGYFNSNLAHDINCINLNT